MTTETIKIDGMTCGGCVASVKNALGRLPLEKADVEIGEASVEYDEGSITHDEIEQAIEGAGFDIVRTNGGDVDDGPPDPSIP